jgi:hypothetical protein
MGYLLTHIVLGSISCHSIIELILLKTAFHFLA